MVSGSRRNATTILGDIQMKIAVLVCAMFAVALPIASVNAKETPPKLPATAKKLTGAEITALYDGLTVNWHNYALSGTGTATYDLKKGSQTGTWNIGGKSGAINGKIRVKGDTFCYTVNSKEECDSIYTDGADIYEVNSKGIVVSKNQKA
jgi:hypothetical protein